MRVRVSPPGRQPFEREWTAGELVVGRSAGADLAIDDASMSRRHARLFFDAGHWFVEDLGARNGTSLNGQRVADRAVRLGAGDVLRLGDTLLTIELDATPPARAAASPPFGSTIFRSAASLSATTDATRLKLLNDFQRALARPIALDALLDLLLERLFAVLQPEEGVVLLRRADGSLQTAATRRSAAARGELVVSRRLVEEVIDRGAAALVTDAALDDRFAGAQSILAAGIRSILAAPLSDAEGCLGMVALYSRIHVRQFSEDDLELLVSLASAAALRVRNVGLAEEAAARRALERELAVAHDIQMGMLPRALPARPAIELAADLRPARAVGGDLYDYFLRDDDLWFIVADVAGKGVGAALFMAVAKTLFRALAQTASCLADVIPALNRELARDNERQVFVTAFSGRLSLADGVLEFANAGHNRPLLVARDGSVRVLDVDSGGPALGVIDDATYTTARLVLAPQTTLLVYTDGVTDARDASGAAFTDARLEAHVKGRGGVAVGDHVRSLVGAVTSFAGVTPQEDDITVLAIQYRGPAPGWGARG